MSDIINGLCRGDNGKIDMKLDGDYFSRNASTGVISVTGWEERFAYGIEWYTDSNRSDCLRIGNQALHKSLPVQKGMRGCLLNDNGEVVKYLDPHGWEHEVRDGSKGQVMVEIPKHYRKVVSEYNTRQVWLSEVPLTGYEEIPLMYIGAYEASYHPTAMQLFSIVNTGEEYRGGLDGSAQWDSEEYTSRGKPKTGLTPHYMRTCARNRNGAQTAEWNILTYDAWKAVYWLYVVEYANRNAQAAFNSALNANGNRQGGLGEGVVNFTVEDWIEFNDSNPLISCGVTDESGNESTSLPYTVRMRNVPNGLDKTIVTNVPRYRGIENPFGHLWKALDGLFFVNEAGTVKAYACSNPENFGDNPNSGYRYICNMPNTEQKHQFITQIAFGAYADIIPTSVGGSSTRNFCDSYLNYVAVGATVAAMQGGDATMSGNAGFLCIEDTPYGASQYTQTTRLCFIPNKK